MGLRRTRHLCFSRQLVRPGAITRCFGAAIALQEEIFRGWDEETRGGINQMCISISEIGDLVHRRNTLGGSNKEAVAFWGF